MDTLEIFPTHAAWREAKYLNADLRQYIFKSHRIIFIVDQPSMDVRILYIRHASMRAVGEPDDPGETLDAQSPPRTRARRPMTQNVSGTKSGIGHILVRRCPVVTIQAIRLQNRGAAV